MLDMDCVDRTPAPVAAQSPRSSGGYWSRMMFWSAGGLLALLLAIACAGALWLRAAARAALPVLDGEIHLAVSGGMTGSGGTGLPAPALSAPVLVRRDLDGVPHIDAATENDLFLAQGYVTAQDRLWQMDIFRRNANGELAEILGPSMLRHDKMQRVLQLRLTARRIYAQLPAADRARLDAYARGVNLFIAQHEDAQHQDAQHQGSQQQGSQSGNSLPPEFRLLDYHPRPWNGVDSVSVGLMMVQMLDTHWEVKLSRELVAARLHNSKLEADLYPVGSWRDLPPSGIELIKPAPAIDGDQDDDEDDRVQANAAQPADHAAQPAGHEDPRALRLLLGLPACEGCVPGSNNWVIAGQHTASGKPLLSNDMHLALTEPNIWYMADLRAQGRDGHPGYHAAGVTLPGIPFVIAGHNQHVAWGFTALYADVEDLFVEELDGKGNYRTVDGRWKPLAVDHEVIHVRGGEDVKLDVKSSSHGPLLNPILTHETRPIALQWTLYDPVLNALPLYQLNVASNWAEFSAALGSWCSPTQNVVYSDDQGHIAYHAIGRVPLRPAGLMGVPIRNEENRSGAHEWRGYIPFDAMPRALDPPSGFLATANSRVTTDKSPYPLSLEWVDPYRVQRIDKALQGRNQLHSFDMLAVQTDVYSEVDQEMAHRFAYAIDHTPGIDDRLRQAARLMRDWDGRLTTDSAAASLVTQTRRALWPLILEPKLGADAKEYEWAERDFAEEEIVMRAKTDWLPPGYKNWDALLTEAVRRGMEQGNAPEDVALWSYGSWHVVDIEHPLARFLPLIGRIAGTGPQPQSGDTTTVKQVGRAFGPSQRFTMDWSDIDGSTENIVLGESGNPLSPYFRDQWNDWYGGTTFALPFSESAVAAQTRHTLRLLP
jgi:penicillin amidase